MDNYLYVAWFRDNLLDSNDQDHEWCACINIKTDSQEKALEWGDYLSKQYSSRNLNEMFFKSYIDLDLSAQSDPSVPSIKYGQIASDKEIGW